MAKDINRQIEERIRAFADELNQLVRQAALEAVQNALGASTPSRAGARGRASAPASSARGRGAGGRRSPRQMSQTMSALRTYVAQNPGARMEHISAALGRPTKELRLPVNKLLAEGAIRSEGHRRATKYYPAGGSGGSRPGGTRKKTSRKKKAAKKKASRKRSARKRR
ncbi:MAG: hypothetical protein ACOC97_01720 [Myxococcota bacterium]